MVLTLQTPTLRGEPRRGMAVRLVATFEEDDPNRQRDDALWIQVAKEGTFKGHSSGEFTFDAEVFATLIRNFRNHPSYVAADDGFGAADVIPYDFHHESEKEGGQLAIVGAPARAWALDLEVRSGEDLELWALTRYLEPARTYVREGSYKWTSVAVWPDAVDPVTGEEVGWYLSSIAFTNDPFIQGMAPIVAKRAPARRVLLEEGELDVDDIVREFRWIFGLTETAGIAEVQVELAKLEALAAESTDTPAGVDVGALVGRVRDLLRLPLLTPAGDVFSAAQELLRRLDDATRTEPTESTPAPMAAGRTEGTSTMSKLITLAKRLKVNATITNEDEAVDAILAHIRKLEESVKLAGGAREKLEAIGKLFGVEDPAGVLDAVSGQAAELEQLKAAIPEMAELLAGQADDEDKAAEEDVDEAIAAHRLPPTAKPALMAMRTGGVELDKKAKLDELRTKLDQRRAQRAKFQAAYPVAPAQQAHLGRPIATQPGQPQAYGPPAGPPPVALSGAPAGYPAAPPMVPAPPGHQQGPSVNLEGYPGRNPVERAMAFCREQPGGDKLSHDQLWQNGCELNRRLAAEAQGLR
jgi:Mu-like prophage I protein